MNQVQYNIVLVFSPVFIPFVDLKPQSTVFIINFILLSTSGSYDLLTCKVSYETSCIATQVAAS